MLGPSGWAFPGERGGARPNQGPKRSCLACFNGVSSLKGSGLERSLGLLGIETRTWVYGVRFPYGESYKDFITSFFIVVTLRNIPFRPPINYILQIIELKIRKVATDLQMPWFPFFCFKVVYRLI